MHISLQLQFCHSEPTTKAATSTWWHRAPWQRRGFKRRKVDFRVLKVQTSTGLVLRVIPLEHLAGPVCAFWDCQVL